MSKTETPSIRFRGFEDAWEQRKLGDIVGIYDGVHQTPNYQNSGVMFLSVENIATLKSSKFISEEDFKRDYKVFPQENDILMTRIGDVGTTNVVTDNGLKAYYVSLALLKYKSTDPYFLSNAIQSDYVQKGLANRTLKTAIPMKINKDEIGKVSVMLPLSATEQQQIGTCFRNLDNLITLHQRKFEKLTNVKKSMLEKMFPKDGADVPEVRFKGFTDAWEQRKVSGVAEICAGGTPSTGIEKYWHPKEIPWLSSGEVHKKYITYTDNKISVEGLNNSSARMIPANSVLIALAGQGKTRGTVAINRISLTTNQSIAAMIFSKEIVPEFVFCNLENRYEEIRRMSSGDGSRGGLNKQIVGEIEIPYASKEEQAKIGAYFSKLDYLITLHQRELEKLQSIKKALLEKMFV